MTDKEKLHQILSSLWKNDESVGKTYYNQALQDVQIAIDSLQEEPVNERFAFKAIPRLLEMIEPTDRAKVYVTKLADALEVEGYSTDAKIVMESLKIMNGEKVPMATMDEEPVSEELEEACEQLAENARKHKAETSSPFFSQTDYRQGVIDGAKWQKTKDESTTEDLGEYINELSKQFPEVSFAKLSRIAVRVTKWQKQKDEKAINENALLYNARLEGIEIGKAEMKQQMIAKAIDAEVLENYDGKVIKYDEAALDEKLSNCNVFDKVKVIVIKEG